MGFTFYKQPDQMDCGPTSLRMIAKHYGKTYSLQRLREYCGISKEGVTLFGISEGGEKIGFQTNGIKINIHNLSKIPLPCVIHWEHNHFVVLYKITKKSYHIADPAKGLIQMNSQQFLKSWIGSSDKDQTEGIALIFNPTPSFYNHEGDIEKELSLVMLIQYLRQYKRLIFQLFSGICVGIILQLILPFLTQALVDTGINTRNLNFVSVIIAAQSMLLLGRLAIDFLRSWILLHISSRLNISILTDFITKLMKLPISFFDTKMVGDILQRMADQGRIQTFLTGPALGFLFSFVNLLVFAVVLGLYNLTIFTVFSISTIVYILWVFLFFNKRRILDYRRFDLASKNQGGMIQLINGIQEIKLNNCEKEKRWEWEKIQAALFHLNVKSLSLGQFQQAGAFLINESKNIIITYIAAKSVINGGLTFGEMMAIQYIIGQLTSPIEQIPVLLQQYQDAKISLERLNEIHALQDESPADQKLVDVHTGDRSISLNNISFQYPGHLNDFVLSNVSMLIPEGKTTAIVGMSGSGKTTILKLLLRFYKPTEGDIKIGHTQLSQVDYQYWRSQCGTVMQDGFIFSDTIIKNIAVKDPYPDILKLQKAIKIANIAEYIDSLPQGMHTKIGAEGNGMSQGQRQRILIARSVYKDPEYIFFDEATNSLDAHNEKIIMENLGSFFKGKTVVVVAHRLSTVQNADNIIIMEKGVIKEQGTHEDLLNRTGDYFQLVKNQLNLGT